MILIEQFDSAHLAHNLLGNPTLRDVVIYLPPSYATSERRYPTLFLLHNFYSRARYWPFGPSLDFAALHRPIQAVLDEVIANGQAQEMIVVMPDGWSKFGCSMWVDSPATGRFKQYVVEEVVAYVDSRFRTLATRDSRGILGTGAGGLGAWHVASRRPDVFGAAGLLSADCHFDVTPRGWLYTYFNSIFPGPPAGTPRGNMPAWFSYAWSTAFTPNPEKPPYYCDFPIDYPSGQVIPELWDKWLSYDPVVNYAHRLDNLRQLRGIFLACGRKDEFHMHYGQRILSRRLSRAGVTHVAREDDGGNVHGMYGRITDAVEWFSQTLAA